MSEEIKEAKKRGRKKKSEGNTEEIENIKKETFSVGALLLLCHTLLSSFT